MNRGALFLLLLISYLPFQAALNLAPDLDLLSGRVLILIIFIVWAVWSFFRREEILALFFPSQTAWALLAFLGLAAFSVLVASNPVWGLRKLFVFISIFPLFWLVSGVIKKESVRQATIRVILGGAALMAGISLGQFLAQFIFGQTAVANFWAARIIPLFSGASAGILVASNPSWLVAVGGQPMLRAIGLFPDPHMLAFYLGLTFPFALAVLFLGKKQRALLLAVNGLLLAVMFLTFSRGGYLGLLAALAVFGGLGWQRFDGAAKKFARAAVFFLVVALLLVGWPIVERLFSSLDLSEGSNAGRLAIWQSSWEVIKSSPVVGIGLGNFPAAADFSGSYRSAITSHNLYLDLWAETGFLGLAAWLILILSAARAAYCRLAREPAIALGALSALVYFSVHAFFETPIFNPTVLAFLMVVLGLASADKIKEDVL